MRTHTWMGRCSTKNLQDLKRKAQSVTVDAEVERITTMYVCPSPIVNARWATRMDA